MTRGFTNIATGNLKCFGDFSIPDSLAMLYQSVKFIGKGRYGVVLRLLRACKDRENDSECSLAVKKFTNPFKDTILAQRCFRELQLLNELRHENIVKMIGVYTSDSSRDMLSNVYLVTEYCGADLGEILESETEQRHVLSLKIIQRMISELLRAMKYLTSAGVIHRDIKPENVAINENLKLTLIDFGLARVTDRSNKMTRDPGSSLYRAIETISFRGQEGTVYSDKADIWGTGALLCEMIIGSPIFDHKHPLLRALELCGPIPVNVLAKIDDRESREFLRNQSKNSVRVNFVEYLKQNGRSWLREEIETVGEELQDFIDRSLVFDHDQRMTVEEALCHPFLLSVREVSREHLASHKMVDVQDKSMEEWKQLVWNVVQSSPISL